MSSIPARPTMLEVDLDAAAHNIRAVRELVGAKRKIFAVIKAGGYGFGAAELGAVFARNGADWLGVADLTEAIRLRLRGIDTPELGRPGARAAASRLAELLREGPVTIMPRAEDVYGRTVADVYVGGRNVADVLRREGFGKLGGR